MKLHATRMRRNEDLSQWETPRVIRGRETEYGESILSGLDLCILDIVNDGLLYLPAQVIINKVG